jgi:hypothetical protein
MLGRRLCYHYTTEALPPPRFERRSSDSKSDVITNYTMGEQEAWNRAEPQQIVGQSLLSCLQYSIEESRLQSILKLALVISHRVSKTDAERSILFLSQRYCRRASA